MPTTKRKYFRTLLTAVLVIASLFSYGQVYQPGRHVVVNDAVAPAQPVPLDARSMFYDSVNFLYRAYNGPTEVLSYLNTSSSRSGHFIMVVDSGGSLQSNGTYVGGYNVFYMFKDSTTNAGLVKMNLFGAGSGSCSTCLLVANNLSDLGSLSTALTNLGLNNVNNTSDATKNAATATLTNKTISGAANTLTNIPNSSLTNSTIGLTLNNTGTTPQVTTTPAALGASLVITVPWGNGTDSGFTKGTDWRFFDGKLDSVHVSNDSVYNCVNGTCTLQSVISGTGGVNSVNPTNSSLLFSPSTGNVLGQVNPAWNANWSGQHTFVSFAPIFSTLTTAGGVFYGSTTTGQLSQTGAGTNGQILESTGGTAPIFFTPGPSTVEGWLGFTPLSGALPSAQILVGNGSNVATAVNMSGAATISNTGVVTLTTPLPAPGLGLTYYPNTSTFAIDSVWQNRFVSLTSPFQNNIYESSVIVDSNAQVLSVPSTQHILKMVCTAGWNNPSLYYFESADTGKTWTPYSGNPLSAGVGYCRSSIHKKGDSLIVYAVPATTGLNRVDRFAMLASGTPNLVLTNDSVIVEGGGSTSFKQNGVDNNWVYYDSDSSAWYMILDGFNGDLGYQDGVFKSTDDIHWTQFSPNGVTNITGPWFTKINGVYWLWGHRSPAPSTSFTFLPTDGYRAYSTDLIHWTPYPVEPTLRRLTLDEGVDSISGQVADLMLVPWGNAIFCFFDGTPNGLIQGSTIPGLQLKRVRFAGTLSQLINTRENASLTNVWQSFSNPTTDLPELYNMGPVSIQTFPDTAAWLTLGAGNYQSGALRFDLTSALPRTVLAAGLFEAVNNYLLYTDSAKTRDTIATRAYARSTATSPGFQDVINNNPNLTTNNTVNCGANTMFFSGSLQSKIFNLDPATGTSAFINLNTGYLQANTSSVQPAITIGGGLNLGAYSATNTYVGGNAQYSSGYVYSTSGPANILQMAGGYMYFGVAPTGVQGAGISWNYPEIVFPSYNVGINSGQNDYGDAALQVTGGLSLHYSNVYWAKLLVGGAGSLDFTGMTGLTMPSNAIPYNASSDSDVVTQTTSGTATFGRVPRGSITYRHSIFTPTTGGTVALVNRQYNIINPSGMLLALTVNLPSSPSNNDVVYIKYTQAITTVTYGNGTVVDGITSPVAGGLVVLTYDSGTTSWY